ncbi:neural proliferation differentiation and control protein 1-like [Bombina bombina]|uniref:neural proliferation differentiation and control protein 1-like n=1 Tax=Bombina bombina TaxID=8345 RepID=UPI00235AA1A4|nr:neural proliferation differentiation and control protein 1-like [Bombina bombina]
MAHAALRILLFLVAVTAAVQRQCPIKLTCVIRRREICAPGSQDCGPCMPQYQETPAGTCVFKSQGDRSKFIGPDTMIDLMHNILHSESKLNKGQRLNSTNPESSANSAVITAPPRSTSPSLPLVLNNSTREGVSEQPETTPFKGLHWRSSGRKSDISQTFSLTLIIICTLTGLSGIFVAALCWYRLQKEVHLAQKMAYTAYKGSQQHCCQRASNAVPQYSQEYQNQKTIQGKRVSDIQQQPSTDSEAEVEEFTIYECPGLAPTGEMEIHNPLFDP